MGLGEAEIDSRLYCDNAAAIQLCVLEAGSWRTRHLRLRGAVARQESGERVVEADTSGWGVHAS